MPANTQSLLFSKFTDAIDRQAGSKRKPESLPSLTVRGVDYSITFQPGTKKTEHSVQCTREGTTEQDGLRSMAGVVLSAANRHVVFDGANKDVAVLVTELVEAIEKDRQNLPAQLEPIPDTPSTARDTPMTDTLPQSTLPLADIKPRVEGDTRAINMAHMVHMAESIAALGVLEPLVIDTQNRLLAGGHRLAACKLLLAEDRLAHLEGTYGALPARIKKDIEARVRALTISPRVELDVIPVHVMDFDSDLEPERALEVEAAENAQRKQYTRDEVKGIYYRLVEAGYTDKEGKPKAGEKAAKPAVAAIIGRSTRTVLRMLESEKATEELTTTNAGLALVESIEKRLNKISKELTDWVDTAEAVSDDVTKLSNDLSAPSLARRITAAKMSLGWRPKSEKAKGGKGKKSEAKKPKESGSQKDEPAKPTASEKPANLESEKPAKEKGKKDTTKKEAR